MMGRVHLCNRYIQCFSCLSSEQKKGSLPAEEKKDMEEMQRNILKRKAQLHEIEQTLPQKNSAYLKVSESNIHLSNCITPPFVCVCVFGWRQEIARR